MAKKISLFIVCGIFVLSGTLAGFFSAMVIPVFYPSVTLIADVAQADERGVDIKNTHDERLVQQFGIAGALTILSAFMILYYWYRPNWWSEMRRKMNLINI